MRFVRSLNLRSVQAAALAAITALPVASRSATIDLDTNRLVADLPNQRTQVFVDVDSAYGRQTLTLSTEDSRRVGGVIAAPEISAADFFSDAPVLSHGSVVGQLRAKSLAQPMDSSVSQSDSVDSGIPTTENQDERFVLNEIGAATNSAAANVPDLVELAVPTGFAAVFGTSGTTATNNVLQNSELFSRAQSVTPSVTAIPEPASIALFGLALPALLMRRREGQSARRL